MELSIAPDDPRADDVRALLARHLAFAHANSPRRDVHALNIEGLLVPEISFYSCREAGALLGVGALKHLDAAHAEIKSMHTDATVRGRGVGTAMVSHLIAEARRRGHGRISLETGTGDVFAPARGLYHRAGFVPCPPFNGYFESPNSCCFTLTLDPLP